MPTLDQVREIEKILSEDCCTINDGLNGDIVERIRYLMNIRIKTWAERASALHEVDYLKDRVSVIREENERLRAQLHTATTVPPAPSGPEGKTVDLPFVWESKVTEAIAALVEGQESVMAEHRKIGGDCVRLACEGNEYHRAQHLTSAALHAERNHMRAGFVDRLNDLHKTLTGKPPAGE